MVHIKKLELRGFKTFNEPVTLVFSKGFNAIVGPNGSGKSNITDSINFVLGQLSSSSLRMNSIADVIFDPTMKTGGTETKQKPAKFARVVMTLDNSDKILPDPSKSVTIFRQVDKTGTSIYKINGKRVTRSELRDFLSFAYLSADGYNIIPQGKISTIIGMTYEQRRQLIEEIAGIQTYDQKKERAKKELAKADINLRQINILVKQNEKTLENLVNEREKAVKFNEIDTKKRNLESQIYKFELKNSKESIKKFERRIREANKTIQASTGKQETESTIVQKYKNEENSLSDELEEWREKQLRNEKEIGGVEGILSSMSAEIQLLETMIQTNQSSNKKDTRNLSQKKKQMVESKDRVKELKEEQRGIQERLKEKQVESESQRNHLLSLEHERNSHLNVLKDAQKNFQSINDSHHSVLTKLESEIARNEEIQRNLDSDTQIVNSYNSKIIEAKDQIKEIKNEISINKERKGKLESRRKNQEKQKRNTHDELEKILESIKKTHDKKLKLETRINAFEEIKEDEEDGGKALNYLKELKRKDLLEGSIGIFSDFVTLDEKKRNFVKTASNGLFNSFIVSNKASLDLCLNALNRKPIGRARFIVLENIKSEIENQPSELEKIKDLVEVPESLNKVNSFIFQDAYLSPTLDEAWEKRNQYKTIVTESGELINNSATIEGGLPLDLRIVIDEDKKQLNEIEKEEERLSNLQNQLIKSSNDQEKLLQLTNDELNSTTDSLRNSQFKIQSLNSQIDSWDFELGNMNNKIKRDKSIVAEVDAQILQISIKEKELKELTTNAENELKELEVKSGSSEFNGANTTFQELTGKINKLAARSGNIDTETSILEKQFKELEDEISDITSSIEQRELTIGSSVANLNEKRQKLIDLENSSVDLEKSKEDIGEEIQEIEEKIGEIKKKSSIHRKKVREYENTIQTELLTITNSELKLVELNQTLIALQESTILYRKIVIPPIPDDFNLEYSKRQVTEYQISLDQLQPVNRKAIDQYEMEKTKNKKLVTQRSKIILDRKTIENFMEEIEREKTNIFLDVFNSINTNFSRVFSFISPGGNAELVLENTESPFLGGVDIKAKPKGKAIKNTKAMSGGEKALTALALVFAIQDFKPAPFYIMDEVDASLDLVNADRIAALIHSLSKNNQFIVISLRDVTIAKAERLIGVVSQFGKSRILSVQMTPGGKLEFAE